MTVIPDYVEAVRVLLEDFETKFLGQRSDPYLILSEPLAAEIDPALPFSAGLLCDHAATYAVPGLQDQHQRSLVQLLDFSCGHEPGEPSTYHDDIGHAHPCPRSD